VRAGGPGDRMKRWIGGVGVFALALLMAGPVFGAKGAHVPVPAHPVPSHVPVPAHPVTPGPVQAHPVTPDPITIGRLQYSGGDWYANPTALPNLLDAIRSWTGIPTAPAERVVRPLDPDLWKTPFLHLTGHGDIRFSPEERAALRAHLERGGFLHADDNYGLDASFRREVALLFPDVPFVEIPPSHPIFRMVFDFPDGLPKIHEHDGRPPSAWGIFHRGRLVLVYTHETDLGNGWEDPEVHGLPEPLRRDALRMGVNLFVYAMTGVIS
jgi:hypothetical protein